ncbi:MAG: hypothetical protein CVU19_02835 [Betaproteobacteria bacterium HGW-Betaproteobacteria-13]|uniref:Uncharacterized protein n=1 Tax=Parazoarcus communis TaxID=41977 RepID=A0A2U8H515_9RHOO|nr:hypothetical protein [Parazoarcus communis]AWI80713.1 hypothetical protein CEW87_15850 [Parazoarcus communis]PKO82257.1 MAG: hypothetical protein CVU19_02835 [Betaproteobacteria bacterium HGW-Betaproteobacteria-13]
MIKREPGSNVLTLLEAAREMSSASMAEHDAEVLLAAAIQHGDLHANIKRWATEQWEGRQLPGNINRLETCIARDDFDAWRKSWAKAD